MKQAIDTALMDVHSSPSFSGMSSKIVGVTSGVTPSGNDPGNISTKPRGFLHCGLYLALIYLIRHLIYQMSTDAHPI